MLVHDLWVREKRDLVGVDVLLLLGHGGVRGPVLPAVPGALVEGVFHGNVLVVVDDEEPGDEGDGAELPEDAQLPLEVRHVDLYDALVLPVEERLLAALLLPVLGAGRSLALGVAFEHGGGEGGVVMRCDAVGVIVQTRKSSVMQ